MSVCVCVCVCVCVYLGNFDDISFCHLLFKLSNFDDLSFGCSPFRQL